MTQDVKRNYLEINSLKDLKEVKKPSESYSLNLLDPVNFQLNKFFYKNIGRKHKWIDRLIWTDSQWIDYVSNKKGGEGCVRDVIEQTLKVQGNWDLSKKNQNI